MMNQWQRVFGAAVVGLVAAATAGRAGEAETAKELTDLGARVTVDEKLPGRPVVAIDFSRPGAPTRHSPRCSRSRTCTLSTCGRAG